MKVTIKRARLAFAKALFTPESVNDGDPRHSAAFIIDPKSPSVAELDKAIAAVATEKWADKAPAVLKKLKEEKRVAFVKGPRTNGDGEVYQGFEGMYSLNASNSARPLIVDRDKTPLTKQDGKPYSGCYVEALIEFWAQDNQYGKRINATLRGVRFLEHGDSFGGGTPATADEFEDIGDATDEDLA